MHLKLSNPTYYPFGMLSIYYREFGYSIAEDAAKAIIPSELTMTYPIHDDDTYFVILKENFHKALATLIEKHAIEAGLSRAKQHFMDDVKRFKTAPKPDTTKYTQRLYALSYEPVDPSTNTIVDIEELAFIVKNIRHDIKQNIPVEPMSYKKLVERYITGKHIIEAPLKDMAKFTDLDRIVETVLEIDGDVPIETIVRKAKDNLMNKYLDKVLQEKFSHLVPEQYARAKEEQYLRNSADVLEKRIYDIWLNGHIPKADAGLTEEEMTRLFISENIEMEPEPDADQAMEDLDDGCPLNTDGSPMFLVDNLLEEMSVLMSDPALEEFPKLALDYKHKFIFKNGFYRTPLEYGIRQVYNIFSPKRAAQVHTNKLYEDFTKYTDDYLKANLRQTIYSFMANKCRQPHLWMLLQYPKSVEWGGHAGFVGTKWLTKMYRAIKQDTPKPDDLTNPIQTSDFSKTPLLTEWFLYRIKLWKNISNKHHDLFLKLSNKHNRSNFRFPTLDEKQMLSGCDSDVWRVIISEFKNTFGGTMEQVYTAIIDEIGQPLPVPDTFKQLCKFFQNEYDMDNYNYDTVEAMVSSILYDKNDKSLLKLWIRTFL
uniref:Uncharacterized protein n=1 Tax=Rhinella marina erythrocytic-like virus TaxID=2859906 RepID=A0A8F6UAZ3_9VIRU|nr:hypothetical protein RMELV009 [Rhinella marina erythrocytic-like virus]